MFAWFLCGCASSSEASQAAPTPIVSVRSETKAVVGRNATDDAIVAPKPDAEALRSVALRFFRALFRGDEATVRRLTYTFEELAEWSTRVPTDDAAKDKLRREHYERLIPRLIKLAEQDPPPIVIDVEIATPEELGPNRKLKVGVLFAEVHPVFDTSESTPRWETPTYFLRTTKSTWKHAFR